MKSIGNSTMSALGFRGNKINDNMKPGAVPVARKYLPLSELIKVGNQQWYQQ